MPKVRRDAEISCAYLVQDVSAQGGAWLTVFLVIAFRHMHLVKPPYLHRLNLERVHLGLDGKAEASRLTCTACQGSGGNDSAVGGWPVSALDSC